VPFKMRGRQRGEVVLGVRMRVNRSVQNVNCSTTTSRGKGSQRKVCCGEARPGNKRSNTAY